MARVTTNHSSTDTDEPKASHDHAGWRRFGHQRNSSAMAATTVAMPSGQRTMFQVVSTHPLCSCSPTAEPNPMATKAMATSTPLASASTNARPYFCTVGRSCSMP